MKNQLDRAATGFIILCWSDTHGRNEFERKLRKSLRLASNANSDKLSESGLIATECGA